MILVCPNCYIRYLLDSQVLGSEGRRVRCSSCQYIWFQTLDEDEEEGPSEDFSDDEDRVAGSESPYANIIQEDIPESVKPEPGEYSADVTEKDLPVPELTGWIAAALVFLLVATGLVLVRDGIVKAWPPAALVFETAGFETPVPGEGLIFDRVRARSVYDDHGNSFLEIEGKIINLRDRRVNLPEIRASLLDEAGAAKSDWKVEIDTGSIGAEESLSFITRYPEPGKETGQVKIGFIM